MLSQYSDAEINRAKLTLESVKTTIMQLIEWNRDISTVDDYHGSRHGMQLLAANCTLITAVGEGVNRINRSLPGFLQSYYPGVPWHAIVSMRNHIAHGYFEVDSEIVFETVKTEMPGLLDVICRIIATLS
ncbi:MAG: DUF86 domain-containing protein [Duncaniella sp.]|nr:DUF86 domain-containing protein [Duncaniella sp.]